MHRGGRRLPPDDDDDNSSRGGGRWSAAVTAAEPPRNAVSDYRKQHRSQNLGTPTHRGGDAEESHGKKGTQQPENGTKKSAHGGGAKKR